MFKHIAIFVLFFANPVFTQNVPYNCENKDGSKGLCKKISLCKSIQSLELPTFCGYADSPDGDFIFCCEDINAHLKGEPSNFHFPGMEVSVKKCLHFARERQRLRNFKNEIEAAPINCGDPIITSSTNTSGKICHSMDFIVGGINADIDEFPHMALLGWEKVNGKSIDWKCGGSLISEDYVLTAAHCLSIEDSELKTSEPTMIRLGGSVSKELKIASIIVHPNYHPPKKYNDIALIKLEQPVELTLKNFPACLWNDPQVQGSATAIGWGTTSAGGDRAQALQKVTLDIYTEELCKTGYPISRSQPEGIQNTQFCAGYQLGGKDACQGDSGGPIQTVNTNNKEMFDVIGITSFGAGCGSSKGGVYTRISSYLEWIEKIVWPYDMKF